MPQAAPRPISLQEFWAIPEHESFHELIGGDLLPKAAPSGEHGAAQAGIVAALHSPFQRKLGGGGGPRGWWITTEVEVQLTSGDVVRPDVLGWRREQSPSRPVGCR
jgi:Uma2 family endonuclease